MRPPFPIYKFSITNFYTIPPDDFVRDLGTYLEKTEPIYDGQCSTIFTINAIDINENAWAYFI